MKPETLKLLGTGLAQVFREHVERELRPLQENLRDTLQRLDKQNERIAELEARSGLKYCGVWESERQYTGGDVATHNGLIWHCWQSTRDRPGSSNAWQMMHKSHD